MSAELGLYIHWPFCAALCPYCDFTRGLWSSAVTQDAQVWAQAYHDELSYWSSQLGSRKLKSIFFGGGTPSLMPIELMQSLFESITKCFGPLDPDIEITIEMNPTSFEVKKVEKMIELGVNRISVGIQSLHPEILTWLGRNHTRSEALDVLSWLKKSGVSFSFDLMYAHKYHADSTVWKSELQEALTYAGDHISLYQLTLEPGTPFAREAQKGIPFVLPADQAADLYIWTQDYLSTAGFSAYEVSNYARNGKYSRHNLVYWRYQDYLGIGSGAHSRITVPGDQKYALVNECNSRAWLAQVQTLGHGTQRKTPLTPIGAFKERLLTGLRLAEGVPSRYLKDVPKRFWDKLHQLQDIEYVVIGQDEIALTLEGRLRMDSILTFLCDDL